MAAKTRLAHRPHGSPAKNIYPLALHRLGLLPLPSCTAWKGHFLGHPVFVVEDRGAIFMGKKCYLCMCVCRGGGRGGEMASF